MECLTEIGNTEESVRELKEHTGHHRGHSGISGREKNEKEIQHNSAFFILSLDCVGDLFGYIFNILLHFSTENKDGS